MSVRTEYGKWTVSSCPRISLSASVTRAVVAARAIEAGGQPQEMVSSCFYELVIGWCQEPSSRIKTPIAIPFHSWTYKKKVFITSSRPRAEAFVSTLLIS
jgi:hypothetical protein